ncbi:O-antigen ligase family protein [Patescibacteria group bacterium]|nr:O-antigen ligase family protein [Patescibacteria group bacterium]MBU0777180.1 O-antigen ligase family protein [Patescibacteria group bacterium]MBU0845875.1 O-antigen ligase family protein [Patescibacteria group bacterium]MBU0922902.1 O-antigen ligase family protein [Patescibacteria group bacterium]MBU1066365.1 O-antigen ligase family protein [Patescibacteria group bacterium]
MITWFANLIPFLFNVLFFFVPLVLFPKTSELFEFNKVVIIYAVTIAIVASWLIKMVAERKVIFRRTILDYPLLIFLGVQLISTVFSIDTHTSFFGYYSRFHGGFLSSLSYSLLYWAYVSNMNFSKTKKAIYITLVSAIFVSIYGVLERLGIDKNIWVQDVQNRIFSTLGQPNWLAAWITALIPITWALIISKGQKYKHYHGLLGIFSLFFLVLLYTKSRSGILGFAASYFTFWVGFYLLNKNIKTIFRSFLQITFLALIITSVIGTPWTPNLGDLFKKSDITESQPASAPVGPALEVGGTESGEIRKIVWKGAINIWKNYPIFGSGVETFAYSYYNFRPVEHNLVSEWDFLYNKAHNEYLNFLATTGTVGFLSYLGVLLFMIYVFVGPWLDKHKEKLIKVTEKQVLPLAFLSGFSSILVTNFFGFSVAPVALLFFLYPAMMVTVSIKDSARATTPRKEIFDTSQTISGGMVLAVTFYLLFLLSRYWYTDTLFAEGKMQNDVDNFTHAREILLKATKYSPKEAVYYDELSEATSGIALSLSESANEEAAEQFALTSINESAKAVELSPSNLNIRRNRARLFIKLSIIDPTYLVGARETLIEAVKLAPTDAKLFYNLGLTLARLGESNEAIEVMEQTIEMKANYRDARFARALLLVDAGRNEEAISELSYILEKISPEDELVRLQLEELK